MPAHVSHGGGGSRRRRSSSTTRTGERHGVRSTWALIRCAATHWSDDDASTLGAALAFYCAFSLAPLLTILAKLAGWIIGAEAAYGQLDSQLTSLFGKSTAEVLLDAIRNSQTTDGTIATIVSAGTLLIGATTVFAALETALEQIWGAKALRPKGVWGFLRARLLSFGLILAIGFLLLVSLSFTTALLALRSIVAARHAELIVAFAGVDLIISTAFVAGLIAVIYRYLPAHRLPWRASLLGALITAVLFQIGRWLIGLYLGRSMQASAFGAAASFAAMLLWLYYSAQIFLYGAELTACLGGLRKKKPES